MAKSKWSKFLNIILILTIAGFIANYIYRLPKFHTGEQVVDFSAVLSDGSHFKMSDLRGSFVLLDFWGSWCGPCRRESPKLVSLYYDYHDEKYKNASNFEIVSVAIETNEAKWKEAIKHDGYIWKYQVGELDRFSSPISSLYGVKQIPTKYFIGPEGDILFVNPSFKEMRKYLESQKE